MEIYFSPRQIPELRELPEERVRAILREVPPKLQIGDIAKIYIPIFLVFTLFAEAVGLREMGLWGTFAYIIPAALLSAFIAQHFQAKRLRPRIREYLESQAD